MIRPLSTAQKTDAPNGDMVAVAIDFMIDWQGEALTFALLIHTVIDLWPSRTLDLRAISGGGGHQASLVGFSVSRLSKTRQAAASLDCSSVQLLSGQKCLSF